MGIELVNGDMFTSGAEALVNPVNCVGVMGAGLALHFKLRFPENFDNYVKVCKGRGMSPGKLLVSDCQKSRVVSAPWGSILPSHDSGHARYIVNFPTKRHWKDKSRLDDVAAGLDALVQFVRTESVKSIAIPPLGCGLGGLDWRDVRPLVEEAAKSLPDVKVQVYVPAGE